MHVIKAARGKIGVTAEYTANLLCTALEQATARGRALVAVFGEDHHALYHHALMGGVLHHLTQRLEPSRVVVTHELAPENEADFQARLARQARLAAIDPAVNDLWGVNASEFMDNILVSQARKAGVTVAFIDMPSYHSAGEIYLERDAVSALCAASPAAAGLMAGTGQGSRAREAADYPGVTLRNLAMAHAIKQRAGQGRLVMHVGGHRHVQNEGDRRTLLHFLDSADHLAGTTGERECGLDVLGLPIYSGVGDQTRFCRTTAQDFQDTTISLLPIVVPEGSVVYDTARGCPDDPVVRQWNDVCTKNGLPALVFRTETHRAIGLAGRRGGTSYII